MQMFIEKIMLIRKVTMRFSPMISLESVADWKLQIYCGLCIISKSHVNISHQEKNHNSLVSYSGNISLFSS